MYVNNRIGVLTIVKGCQLQEYLIDFVLCFQSFI
jgi:hypothetical protein